MDNIPQHIVIIPDGNRRWAKERNLDSLLGHKAGVENLFKLIEKGNELGVKYMTFWGFSTENYKRDEAEVKYLFNDIFYESAKKYISEIDKYNAGFRHIGRKDRMPKKVSDLFNEIEEKTKDRTEKIVTIAIDYGGRDEILRAVKKMMADNISEEGINEELLSSYLDTHGLPDPDMIIRTSGEKRLSGFMPWQTVYSELFFVDDYFPDFTPDKLEDILKLYSQRNRRFGGNSK